ncbi:site-specific integrase [Xanthobacter sp. V4C-4]|uniref:DUF6538 domain-containing protein n=1 Tax=Xanthobacter cornucopiae TaxID=3119924 RepID=UPI00372C1535
MASRHDRRHLEQHGNQWRVRIKVPKEVRPTIGSAFLVEGLHTDSLSLANARKWEVIARLKGRIEQARQQVRGADLLGGEAMEWRDRLQAEDDPSEGVMSSLLTDRAYEIEHRHGYRTAKAFVDVATGKATLVEPLVDMWLTEAQYAGRTEAAYRQAFAMLSKWAATESVPLAFEALPRKVAGKFMQDAFITPGASAAVANKLLAGLSALWSWAIKRGHADENPWRGQGLKAKKAKAPDGGGSTRPFADAEVTALLKASEGTHLGDMSQVAALTGMRLGEIAALRVADVHLQGEGPFLQVVEGKTDAASRAVPVHPDLLPLLTARCQGKAGPTYLFPELTTPESQERSRGASISLATSRLLRELKLEDKLPGHRQARTGFTAWTLADVVGHSKEAGPLPMTMGRYPGAAGMEAKRACVLAVKLPA